MRLHLTSSMTAEEMEPLWDGIRSCLAKYVRHFKEDETVENVIRECAEGRKQLWIVTEGDKIVLAATTELVTITATGKKQLVLAQCGGSRYAECLSMLDEILEWGREQGAVEAVTLCRRGLVRLYEPLGFRAKAVAMSRPL